MAACPICGKAAEPNYRPFCSRRCADVDLQRWLVGGYSIAGTPAEEADDEPLDPDADAGWDEP